MDYLYVLIGFPLACALCIFVVDAASVKRAAALLSLGCLVIAFFALEERLLASEGDTAVFEEAAPITLNLSLFDARFGLDWTSCFLVMLNAVLTFLSIYSTGEITKFPRFYYASFFLSYMACNGVFLARDLISFYVFWELSIIPMFFIIGIWGGARRVYATIKFVLFTLVGSIAMLGSIIYIFTLTGVVAFSDLPALIARMPAGAQKVLFICFMLAFSIKVPMFPLHTWLPDAHVEAPTGGSVVLAGVLLKLGAYAYVKVLIPFFTSIVYSYGGAIMALGIAGIIYGALMSFLQNDIKKIIAYSSVSHMGFVVLGAFSMTNDGLNGAYLQMINHGVSTGMLFLLVGALYQRAHTRDIDAFGGVASSMKLFSFFFLLASLASVGLPGLNGFPGEFLVFAGSYRILGVKTLLAIAGVVLSACYMFRLWNNVFWGRSRVSFRDVTFEEALCLAVPSALIIALGVYPSAILDKIIWSF